MNKVYQIFLGTTGAGGFVACRQFDPEKGLELDSGSSEFKVPGLSYLAVDDMDGSIYLAADREDGRGEVMKLTCSASSQLFCAGKAVLEDGGLSHLQKKGKSLLVSSYRDGSLYCLEPGSDGELKQKQRMEFHGSGPVSGRQDSSHPHSAFFSPDGMLAAVSDLGADRVYWLHRSSGGWRISGEWVSDPGTGPRHAAFSPGGGWLFLLTELSSEIIVFQKEGEAYLPAGKISALPAQWKGESLAADLKVSRGGFLYASNRGHNSISVLSVDWNSGKIKLLQSFPTLGWPRSIAVSSDCRWLFAADEEYADSKGGLEIMELNPRNGLILSRRLW